ncbi:MAG: adenylosuccinate lyase, partial [Polyangiales bacterium]
MIPRYTPAEFQDLWSQKRKYETWFDIEVAACRAMESAGLVPAGTADAVAPFRAQLDPDAIDEIEKVTRHDVIAFLTHVEG